MSLVVLTECVRVSFYDGKLSKISIPVNTLVRNNSFELGSYLLEFISTECANTCLYDGKLFERIR